MINYTPGLEDEDTLLERFRAHPAPGGSVLDGLTDALPAPKARRSRRLPGKDTSGASALTVTVE